VADAAATATGDYVLATGETHSVCEFVELAFSEIDRHIDWVGEGVDEKGLDAHTGETLVVVDPRYFRPTEVDLLLGHPTTARECPGWVHKTPFHDLVKEMVASDLEVVRREQARHERDVRLRSARQANLGGRQCGHGWLGHRAAAARGRLHDPYRAAGSTQSAFSTGRCVVDGAGAARVPVRRRSRRCLRFPDSQFSDGSIISVGTGEDVAIRELAELVCRTVGFHGSFVYDRSRPDGTLRKVMNVARMTSLGWRARTPLNVGVRLTYAAFLGKDQARRAEVTNPRVGR